MLLSGRYNDENEDSRDSVDADIPGVGKHVHRVHPLVPRDLRQRFAFDDTAGIEILAVGHLLFVEFRHPRRN